MLRMKYSGNITTDSVMFYIKANTLIDNSLTYWSSFYYFLCLSASLIILVLQTN